MNPNARSPLRRMALLAGLAMITGATSLCAYAVLGGGEATVLGDQQQMSATQRVLRPGAYTVHEMQTPSGTVVREYVSPEGVVFGVAWSGPTMPDLRQLLGPYFEPYASAVAQRKARGPVVVQLPGAVVQSAGHMRAYTGSAYLAGALPQGVTAETVK